MIKTKLQKYGVWQKYVDLMLTGRITRLIKFVNATVLHHNKMIYEYYYHRRF
ncbi:hypothetical protein [Agriterribacter sp.]|uniref:hypothetical protein n=1 Tax=Agriterribacter sp. TaxID=2821509 RepID=UPI002BB181A0|nr:hypothetical protein [Agriterribacter sp.]HTN08613.1 hypothetical protein [Agriterribacter sp.]